MSAPFEYMRGGVRSGKWAQAVKLARITGIPIADVYARWRNGNCFCALHGWTKRTKNNKCAVCIKERNNKTARKDHV